MDIFVVGASLVVGSDSSPLSVTVERVTMKERSAQTSSADQSRSRLEEKDYGKLQGDEHELKYGTGEGTLHSEEKE